MTRRWQLVLPLLGLLGFSFITYDSIRLDRQVHSGPTRYFYWSFIRLDKDPLNRHPQPSKNCAEQGNCDKWHWVEMWVDPGWPTKFILLSSFPAFIVGGLLSSVLGKLGISQVLSFFAFVPPLVLAWYFFLGWLLDRHRVRRVRKREAGSLC